MREDFKQQMEEELKYVDVTLTDRQIEQFYRYYELLNEWNQVMNLTAITEMKEVVTNSFHPIPLLVFSDSYFLLLFSHS